MRPARSASAQPRMTATSAPAAGLRSGVGTGVGVRAGGGVVAWRRPDPHPPVTSATPARRRAHRGTRRMIAAGRHPPRQVGRRRSGCARPLPGATPLPTPASDGTCARLASTPMLPDVDAERALAELDELHALTGDPETGARRVAWSADWARAREWLCEQLEPLPVTVERDEAGNLWALLPGASDRVVAVGSHLDSVPGGGRLDGALGVLAALTVLRAAAASGEPPARSLALVDWVDEEGRFGRSLYGSGAAAGSLDLDAARTLADADGHRLPDVLAEHGIDLARVHDAGARLRTLDAYLELHIEQGPVLEERGDAVAAVTGTAGTERRRLRFTGRSGHAGTVPMAMRRDPLAAAAATALAVGEIARRHGGVGTVGAIEALPGIPTAIPGSADLWLDQRHQAAEPLAAMVAEALKA